MPTPLLAAVAVAAAPTPQAPDLEIRTRIHHDFVESDLGALGGDLGDRRGFRRVRLLVDGELGDRFRYRLQPDFSDTAVDWKDAWAELRDVGPTHVRAGHFREPMGLEALTSATYTTFVERADPIQALTPGRARGAMAYGRHARGVWQLGAFRASEGDPFPDELGDETGVTGRLTFEPARDDGSGLLTQVGLSASLRDPDGDAVRFRTRPGSQLLPRVADTGPVAADDVTLVGLEGLWQSGPWSAQAEWLAARVDDATLTGAYAQASWFLTGERRGWSDSRGAHTAPEVADVLGLDGPAPEPSRGAWELGARVSRTDLVDGPIDGGVQETWTLGVNHYLAPGTRVMVDWARVDVDGADGTLVVARVQVQF